MKTRKYIFYILVAPPILFLIIYFTGFLIYQNEWKYEYSKEQMQSWLDEINNTPSLGANFYSVFDTLKMSNLEQTLHFEYLLLVKYHFTGVKNFHRGSGQNYYFEASKLLLKKHNIEINTLLNPKLTLAFGLEKNAKLKKCVDYYYYNLNINLLTDSTVYFNLTGAKEFSNNYFQKELEELNEKEIITLISAIDLATYKDTLADKLIEKKFEINDYILKRMREKLKK